MTRQERRVQVVSMKDAGMTNKEIAFKTGLTVRGIQKIFRNVKETKSFKDRPRKGRPHKLTARNKSQMVRMIKKKEATTATTISKALKTHHNIQVRIFLDKPA